MYRLPLLLTPTHARPRPPCPAYPRTCKSPHWNKFAVSNPTLKNVNRFHFVRELSCHQHQKALRRGGERSGGKGGTKGDGQTHDVGGEHTTQPTDDVL